MLFRFSTPLLISCSLHLRRFVKISNYWYAYISPCVTSNSFSFFKIVVELSLLKHFSQNSLFLDNYNCNPCLCLKKKNSGLFLFLSFICSLPDFPHLRCVSFTRHTLGFCFVTQRENHFPLMGMVDLLIYLLT